MGVLCWAKVWMHASLKPKWGGGGPEYGGPLRAHPSNTHRSTTVVTRDCHLLLSSSHVYFGNRLLRGGLCVGAYVWGPMRGGLCVGAYVWGPMCGGLCVGAYVWGPMRGGLCVGAYAWGPMRGGLCVGACVFHAACEPPIMQ